MNFDYITKMIRTSLLVLISIVISCNCSKRAMDPQTPIQSRDVSSMKSWDFQNVTIPAYTWNEGTPFGDGLHVDSAYDPQGVSIEGDRLHFHINPMKPSARSHGGGEFNFRSEIRTAPWPIKHEVGTEQWIGWRYEFGDNYIIDETSPITIYQNHNGVTGLSPAFEIEIAALDRPRPAVGGEFQIVNAANEERIVVGVQPKAGSTVDVVVQVVYGRGSEGLLRIWFNGVLYYDQETSTVYEGYEWGGNNKWGVYHHTFNASYQDVHSSISKGTGTVDLYMTQLKVLTRDPDHHEYKVDAQDMVKPKGN